MPCALRDPMRARGSRSTFLKQMGRTRGDWDDVDRYFSRFLHECGDVFDEVLQRNAAAGLPPHDVSPLQGRFLSVMLRAIRARRVLELGTLGGDSTIWMASVLPDDGALIPIELEEHYAAVARTNIMSTGLTKRVDVRVAPARSILHDMVVRANRRSTSSFRC
jgi:predicted O-methyltransferase YrrM